MNASKDLLTRKDVVKYFKDKGIPVGHSTLKQFKVDIPFYKFDRAVRYRLQDLEAWVESKRVCVRIEDLSALPPPPATTAAEAPKKKKEPKPAPTDIDQVKVGEIFQGRKRMSKFVWLTLDALEQFEFELVKDELDWCVEKLDGWVAQKEPLPGERESKEFIERKRKGWNGAACFRTWVIADLKKTGPKIDKTPFNPASYY